MTSRAQTRNSEILGIWLQNMNDDKIPPPSLKFGPWLLKISIHLICKISKWLKHFKVFTHSLALCHLKISYIIHRWDSSYDISDTNFFLIAKLWENKKCALKIQWCGKPYHYFMKKEEPISLLDPTQALTLL